MAHITIDEEDYTFVADAANGAHIAGMVALSNGLDKIARKINAAIMNKQYPNKKKLTWQDCPSCLSDPLNLKQVGTN